SWSKSVGSINYKWLIPASIALGIGITLYFINPLLDLGPQSSTRVETPEQNQGPIFAPGPDESMAVLSAKDTNTVSSDTITSAESVEPAEDSKELLAEAPQPSDAKKEPETAVISQPSEPDPTPIATIDRKSESPVDGAPIIATPTETPKPSEGPKAVRMRSQELRDLRKVINSANALESELSDLTFRAADLSKSDQSYLQQVNSELRLLGQQIEKRVVFDDDLSIKGWKKTGNNAGWLKQMNASVRQHQANIKRIQASLD
ncbi:MAG: hypothetical protein AAFQ87_16975, partial [Bacteroidota bacterium]